MKHRDDTLRATRTRLLARGAELRERIRRVRADLRREQDPLPRDSADAALDSDNDGVANADEYVAGTDPLDTETNLNIYFVRVEGRAVSVVFLAWAGKTYSVLRRDSVDRG